MVIKWPDMNRPVSLAPLATFRITFGLLMFGSLLRFWARGWIESSYVAPTFHFTYWGFGWVQPLGATGMQLLFGILILASLLIALGLFYRPASVVFFLGFTYVELIDVTTYLNHYYFISLVAFLLIWLPANRDHALDARFGLGATTRPNVTLDYWNPALSDGHRVPLRRTRQTQRRLAAAGRANENLASCQKPFAAHRAADVRRVGRLPLLLVRRGLRFIHCFFSVESSHPPRRLRVSFDFSRSHCLVFPCHRNVPLRNDS